MPPRQRHVAVSCGSCGCDIRVHHDHGLFGGWRGALEGAGATWPLSGFAVERFVGAARGAGRRGTRPGFNVGGPVVDGAPLRCSPWAGAVELAARLTPLRSNNHGKSVFEARWRAPSPRLRSSAPTRRPARCPFTPGSPRSWPAQKVWHAIHGAQGQVRGSMRCGVVVPHRCPPGASCAPHAAAWACHQRGETGRLGPRPALPRPNA